MDMQALKFDVSDRIAELYDSEFVPLVIDCLADAIPEKHHVSMDEPGKVVDVVLNAVGDLIAAHGHDPAAWPERIRWAVLGLSRIYAGSR